VFAIVALLSAPAAATAASGDLDPLFGTDGVATVRFGSNGEVRDVLALADGRLVVVGSIKKQSSDQSRIAVARLLPNGEPDSSFGGDGRVTKQTGYFNRGGAVAVQSDGKLVVVGSSETDPAFQAPRSLVVLRYMADGSLDPGFGTGGVVVTSFDNVPTFARDVLVQPDASILVLGDAQGDLSLLRYLSDGTRDMSFGTGSVAVTPAYPFGGSLVRQPDGRLLVASSGPKPGDPAGTARFLITRFASTGAPDDSFGGGDGIVRTRFVWEPGDFDASMAGLVLRRNGRIVAVGTASSSTGSRIAIARYLSDGSRDPSFSGNGRMLVSIEGTSSVGASAVVRESDGRFVAAGGASGGQALLVRFERDGSFDTTFGTNGAVTTTALSFIGSLARQPGGLLVGADSAASTLGGFVD
jgi:uncharacterized delta-60 repeat protein